MRAVKTVAATRYVTPLREGGSLPAIIEADDDGMYVLKFRGGEVQLRLVQDQPATGTVTALMEWTCERRAEQARGVSMRNRGPRRRV